MLHHEVEVVIDLAVGLVAAVDAVGAGFYKCRQFYFQIGDAEGGFGDGEGVDGFLESVAGEVGTFDGDGLAC